jgi:transcriptional regulator with XRE-family HTH domain
MNKISKIEAAPRTPARVDIHVGTRVRARRKLLSLSQERLADALGLTFQQVQKYERGVNRISASKLYEIARFLECPISYFFEGLPESPKENGAAIGDPQSEFFACEGATDLAIDYVALPTKLRTTAKRVIHDLRGVAGTTA